MSPITRSMALKRAKYCAFLDLPSELRNIIYDYVLATNDSDNGDEEEEEPDEGTTPSYTKLDDASPPSEALALTCRQVYTEFVDIFRKAHEEYFATHTAFCTGYSYTCWCAAGPDCTQSRMCAKNIKTPHNCLRGFRNQDTERINALDFNDSPFGLELRKDAEGGWFARVAQTGSTRPRTNKLRQREEHFEDFERAFDNILYSRASGSWSDGLTKEEIDQLLRRCVQNL